MEPRWLIGEPEVTPVTERSEVPQKADRTVSPVPSVRQGTYKGKTAAQWREIPYSKEAAKCAELAERDGIWEFPALFTLTGALVPQAVYVRTRLGKWVWRIGVSDTPTWFDPSKALSGATRRRNDAAKGFALGVIRARGYVGTRGTGFFIGMVNDSPIEIVDDGKLGTQYQDR